MLFRSVRSAQKVIDRLEPKVNIHLPVDLPLPSVGIIKKMAAIASKVNGLEPEIKIKTDDELRAKTQEFRLKIQEAISSYEQQLADIEKQYRQESDHERRDSLLNEVDKAKQQLTKKREEILDVILPEAFAVVREAAWRTLEMRHFDVQLAGGMILHKGNIVEMATGEGKTLVATLPTYLNALAGKVRMSLRLMIIWPKEIENGWDLFMNF